jgi:hypothetical protein
MKTRIPTLEEAVLCSLALLFNDQTMALSLLRKAYLSRNDQLVISVRPESPWRVRRALAESLRLSRNLRTHPIPVHALEDLLSSNRLAVLEEPLNPGSGKDPGFFQLQCSFDGTIENWLYTKGI